MVLASELQSIANYCNLPLNDKTSLLQKAFKQWGESIQYRIGNLPHSIASCVIRIANYQSHRPPSLFTNEQRLVQIYFELEKEWAGVANVEPYNRF